MFRKLLVCATLALSLNPALAAEPTERGGYIGGGIGGSVFDDDGAFGGFVEDDSDTAIMVFGGYKFLPYFAVEGRYEDFGSFDFGGVGLDASAVSIHAVGILPFGASGWELFGQFGFGVINFEIEGFGDDDQSAVAGGIGIRFSPTENFAIGIQTDVFVWEDDSLGPTYDMSVGGTVLSARLIF